MARSLSTETENMGFPIRLSNHISSATDKEIIMFLTNCKLIFSKCEQTGMGNFGDVCFLLYCQLTPGEHGRHSMIRCTNQIMMSLLFAHL